MVAILVPDYMTIPLHYFLVVFLRLNLKSYLMQEPNKKKKSFLYAIVKLVDTGQQNTFMFYDLAWKA